MRIIKGLLAALLLLPLFSHAGRMVPICSENESATVQVYKLLGRDIVECAQLFISTGEDITEEQALEIARQATEIVREDPDTQYSIREENDGSGWLIWFESLENTPFDREYIRRIHVSPKGRVVEIYKYDGFK